MSSFCTLVINPDVSGGGVRAAIYTQNILCFVPAVWAIADGTVSDYELEAADTHSTTNLVLAFAILTSSIFQGASRRLTNYHAAIVLSLSWMNNTNAFIYFLLYVQHKSQGEGPARIEPTLSAWVAHIKARAKTIFCLPDGLSPHRLTQPPFVPSVLSSRERGAGPTVREAFKLLCKRVTILLGSLHLTLMAAFGIWVWSSPRSFGSPDSAECAAEVIDLTIIGGHVRFGSPILRSLSLAIYSVVLLPGLNLLLPTLPFLAYHCWYHKSRCLPLPAATPGPTDPRMPENVATRLRRVRTVIVGLAFLLILNVIFITDIELTLRQNAHLQTEDEDEWGFGQILAMLLVFMPLRDLVEAILRRKQEMQTKLDNALIDGINKRNLEEINRWVRAGANVFVEGERGETALHLACTDKAYVELVVLLMDRKADPTHKSNNHITAYEAAYLAENMAAAQAMVRHEPDFGKAVFGRAVREREWGLVEALVRGAGVGTQAFPDGTTALGMVDGAELQTAIGRKDWDGIRTLTSLGMHIDPAAFEDNAVALQAAVSNGYWDVVIIIAGLGSCTDPTAIKEIETVLHLTCTNRAYNDLVVLLMKRGADPTRKSGGHNTAYEAAYTAKNLEGVRVMVRHGTPDGGKSLLVTAIRQREFKLVEALTGAGIGVETTFSDGTTALEMIDKAELQAAISSQDWHGIRILAALGVRIDSAISEDNAATLQAAISKKDWETVHLLAGLGVRTDSAASRDNEVMLQFKAAIYRKDWDGVRALMSLAVCPVSGAPKDNTCALQAFIARKDWEIVRLLVRIGTRTDPAASEDNAALLQAAISSEDWDGVRVLVDLGIHFDPVASKDNAARLQAVISRKEWDIVRLLAGSGIQVNPAASEENTATLQAAISSSDWGVARLLAGLGIQADPAASKENTATLQVAISRRDWDIARLLAGSGIHADPAASRENTVALQALISIKDWSNAHLLMTLGVHADPAASKDNKAALQVAISRKEWAIVRLLVHLGIRIDPPVFEDSTAALQVAIFNKDWETVRRLAGLGIHIDPAASNDNAAALQTAILYKDWDDVHALASSRSVPDSAVCEAITGALKVVTSIKDWAGVNTIVAALCDIKYPAGVLNDLEDNKKPASTHPSRPTRCLNTPWAVTLGKLAYLPLWKRTGQVFDYSRTPRASHPLGTESQDTTDVNLELAFQTILHTAEKLMVDGNVHGDWNALIADLSGKRSLVRVLSEEKFVSCTLLDWRSEGGWSAGSSHPLRWFHELVSDEKLRAVLQVRQHELDDIMRPASRRLAVVRKAFFELVLLDVPDDASPYCRLTRMCLTLPHGREHSLGANVEQLMYSQRGRDVSRSSAQAVACRRYERTGDGRLEMTYV